MSEQMTPLCWRMLDDRALRNMAPLTQQAYMRAVKSFSLFFRRSPNKLTGQSKLVLLGIRDITEVLHFQAAARGIQSRYEALVRASAQIVWTTDASGADRPRLQARQRADELAAPASGGPWDR